MSAHESGSVYARKADELSMGAQAAAATPIVVAGYYNPLTAAAGLGTVMRALAPAIANLHVVCIENRAPQSYRHADTGHWIHPLWPATDLIQSYHRIFCKAYLSHKLHEEPAPLERPEPHIHAPIQEFSRAYVGHLFKVLERTAPKPIVWFNDYAMVPVLREFCAASSRQQPIAVSIRSSFGVTQAPQVDEYTRSLILEGLLGADFVSFHRRRDVYHFLDMVKHYAPNALIDWTRHEVQTAGHTVRVGAVAMGADADHWRKAGASSEACRIIETLRRDAAGQTVLLSVSRLERHKAISFEFDVIERFLTYFPEFRNRVRYIRITPFYPECASEPYYIDLKSELDARAAEINRLFGDESWQPIHLLSGPSLSHNELAGYYRAADAVLVLSSADGFNHVSVESVLAKQPEDPPLALLLSDTGSSDYLEGAFISAAVKSAAETSLRLGRTLQADAASRRRLHDALLGAASALKVTDWMQQILGAAVSAHRFNVESSRGRQVCAAS